MGKTNADGVFFAEMPSYGHLYYSAAKEDYYSGWGDYQFEPGGMKGDFTRWINHEWLPRNPVVELNLKRKDIPIPMFAKEIGIAPPISTSNPVGFDFVIGDWTAPNGQGKTADIFFSATGAVKKNNLVLTWTFPNKGDGIQIYSYEGGPRSELRSPTQAPEDGYSSKVTIDSEGRPIGQSSHFRPLCFVFRVRTVLDKTGNVVSANYGKIYPEAYKIVYYFNPASNSRGLEFDIKHNLFTNLESYERINEP